MVLICVDDDKENSFLYSIMVDWYKKQVENELLIEG